MSKPEHLFPLIGEIFLPCVPTFVATTKNYLRA